jgi:hypothetical protein
MEIEIERQSQRDQTTGEKREYENGISYQVHTFDKDDQVSNSNGEPAAGYLASYSNQTK